MRLALFFFLGWVTCYGVFIVGTMAISSHKTPLRFFLFPPRFHLHVSPTNASNPLPAKLLLPFFLFFCSFLTRRKTQSWRGKVGPPPRLLDCQLLYPPICTFPCSTLDVPPQEPQRHLTTLSPNCRSSLVTAAPPSIFPPTFQG